uniref:Expressed protein n=2 Tax=Oryza TaxID=4527 RepID=Q2R5J3_ORYSJ|nr:expressed protein [Oryza sativa Japonica Group]BAG91700.1 unnamed protein product [Oryza sativa Japonica Group]
MDGERRLVSGGGGGAGGGGVMAVGMVVVGVGVPRFSQWSSASACPASPSGRRRRHGGRCCRHSGGLSGDRCGGQRAACRRAGPGDGGQRAACPTTAAKEAQQSAEARRLQAER